MDRVQVLKRESSAGGGDPADEAPWDSPIEPQEDALEAAGLYVQDAAHRDETTLISRSGDDMLFKDGNNPTAATLSELLGGEAASLLGKTVFKVDGGMIYNTDGDVVIKVNQ